jgi:hypothetical protein
MSLENHMVVDACWPRKPAPLLYCDKCGRDIFAGDEYYSPAAKIYCAECLDDMPARELLALCGENMLTACKE